ncbi:hypothetical protein D9M71_470360 [compost metagenome]
MCRARGVAQAGGEVEIERRVGLHPRLAGEHLALLQVQAGKRFLVNVILAVVARLTAPLTGAADAFTAIQGNIDAVAQGGVEEDFVGLYGKEQGFAVGKAERYFVIHASVSRGSEVVEVEHRVDGVVEQQHMLAADQPAVGVRLEPVGRAAIELLGRG